MILLDKGILIPYFSIGLRKREKPFHVFPISPAVKNLLRSRPLRFYRLSRGGKHVQQRQRHLE